MSQIVDLELVSSPLLRILPFDRSCFRITERISLGSGSSGRGGCPDFFGVNDFSGHMPWSQRCVRGAVSSLRPEGLQEVGGKCHR